MWSLPSGYSVLCKGQNYNPGDPGPLNPEVASPGDQVSLFVFFLEKVMLEQNTLTGVLGDWGFKRHVVFQT